MRNKEQNERHKLVQDASQGKNRDNLGCSGNIFCFCWVPENVSYKVGFGVILGNKLVVNIPKQVRSLMVFGWFSKFSSPTGLSHISLAGSLFTRAPTVRLHDCTPLYVYY